MSGKNETFEVTDNRRVIEFMNVVQANVTNLSLQKGSSNIFGKHQCPFKGIYDELKNLVKQERLNDWEMTKEEL